MAFNLRRPGAAAQFGFPMKIRIPQSLALRTQNSSCCRARMIIRAASGKITVQLAQRLLRGVLRPVGGAVMWEELCAVAIMAKASIAGTVKTRLVPPLIHEEAAELNTS